MKPITPAFLEEIGFTKYDSDILNNRWEYEQSFIESDGDDWLYFDGTNTHKVTTQQQLLDVMEDDDYFEAGN